MKFRRRKLSVTTTQLAYLFIVCVAVIRATQFHVARGDNMDLARHFRMMELIKSSNYSLFEYVFAHGDVFTSNISMRFCYSFNLIVYLSAKYLSNYYLMAWLFVLVDYSIIAYIGLDWWRSQGGRKSHMAVFEILICFSLFPYIHAVSGLRMAMSACVIALGIYLYIGKNGTLKSFIIITIVAATFHPAVVIASIFAVLAKTTDRRKGLIITVVGCSVVSLIANLFIRSPNRFLYSIAYKYLQYTGEGGYRSTRFCYYGVIVICLLCLAQYFYAIYFKKKHVNGKTNLIMDIRRSKENQLYDCIAYYMIFILSNIGNYEMVLRPGYVLGAMAPLVTGMAFAFKEKTYKRDIISQLIRIMLFVIITYVSYMYLNWHSEFFAW